MSLNIGFLRSVILCSREIVSWFLKSESFFFTRQGTSEEYLFLFYLPETMSKMVSAVDAGNVLKHEYHVYLGVDYDD